MVKQKVPSHSFSMDQQGTQGEGSQPAQPVKAGSEVPELHSMRNRNAAAAGEKSREEEDSNGGIPLSPALQKHCLATRDCPT